ncbi:hypothetical protein EPH_0039240 [Eimeria praecox]|uniref:Uncharacterized protein n=1 Tax=Eimeria praecox TaxID=51316 RepID=U6GRA8_9EIME|nr:hypothetical protein EPH_0039240 [Eimeria praecox]
MRSNMRRSVSLAIVSLGILVAFSKQLGTAEASLSASQASLTHDEVQVRDESVFAREARLKASGRRARTVALVSLIAVAAALVFAVYKCFRGLESQRAVGGQKVAARRLAEGGDGEDGEEAAAPEGGDECGTPEAPRTRPYGFYAGLPVGFDGEGGIDRLLIKVEGGRFYMAHPETGENVPLIVKWQAGLGPMLYEASTGYDLEWALFNPHKLKPQDLPMKPESEEAEEEAEEEEEEEERLDEGGGGEEEARETYTEDDGDVKVTVVHAEEETQPETAAIVYKPEEPEWVPDPESLRYPYVVFVGGMPVQVDPQTMEYKEILLTVRNGDFNFKHPGFLQMMRVTYHDGTLYGPENLPLKEIVEDIERMGPQ